MQPGAAHFAMLNIKSEMVGKCLVVAPNVDFVFM